LTPETDTSCFYFWSVANGFLQDEPAATEQLFAQVAFAFLEDKTVVEGQQLRLTELGEAALVDIATDAARLHMRRTVERVIGGGGADGAGGRVAKARRRRCQPVRQKNFAGLDVALQQQARSLELRAATSLARLRVNTAGAHRRMICSRRVTAGPPRARCR